MNNFISGLRKFSEEIFPQKKSLFEALSLGQSPHTLMITCSDSRINPHLVTQTDPGELFIIRNAGNIIPPYGSSLGGEEAAIEFAIDGLKVSNIVICGHSHCGAMAALMGKVNLDNLPSVKKWLCHAQNTKKRAEAIHLNHAPSSIEVIEENILAQSDNIKTHPSVSAALRQNRIKIFGWVYHFDTGKITIYDNEKRRFIPSSDAREDNLSKFNRFEL